MQRANIKKTYLNFSSLDNRPKTDKIVIHHTGNPTDDNLSAIAIHSSHQAQGWSGIGYHYVVRKDGTVEEGRPHWTIGAHAYGDNSHTLGIHVCGNFEIGQPTDAQIESLAMLISGLAYDYGLPINDQTVVAHRDLMPTACCGKNLYEQLDTVRWKANW